ncbi:hypothetical protein KKF84_15365 [Myxococcota bacterium]|nr:hypothetical protein [Myxococcota bacterium]MBU1536702.1 hypothetical protein [Myxococcota bacterium]
MKHFFNGRLLGPGQPPGALLGKRFIKHHYPARECTSFSGQRVHLLYFNNIGLLTLELVFNYVGS